MKYYRLIFLIPILGTALWFAGIVHINNMPTPKRIKPIEIKDTIDRPVLSRSELIDAIASGSKLTKADAG